MLAFVVFVASASLVACSGSSVRHSPTSKTTQTHAVKTNLSNKNTVLKRLNQQYAAWRGVPYKFGGIDKRGIDCSGFVYMALKKGLGITVPRSTTLLAKSGTDISNNKLRPGDLVFFKTGWGKRHVGIYLEKDQFMHASTSKGVMKSKLSNPYWRKHYWKSARIL